MDGNPARCRHCCKPPAQPGRPKVHRRGGIITSGDGGRNSSALRSIAIVVQITAAGGLARFVGWGLEWTVLQQATLALSATLMLFTLASWFDWPYSEAVDNPWFGIAVLAFLMMTGWTAFMDHRLSLLVPYSIHVVDSVEGHRVMSFIIAMLPAVPYAVVTLGRLAGG